MAMSSTSKKRQPRPTTFHFHSPKLVEDWKPLAELKEPGFKWDGTSYGRGRQDTPNVTDLAKHTAALDALISMAPSGFPAHTDLRATFLALQETTPIMEGPDKYHFNIATDSADNWRVMCRHIYKLKTDD